MGDGVTYIGDEAFVGCRNLKGISLPDSLTAIGEQAFHYCQSLTEVAIPASVTLIKTGAFSGCENLTRIAIPEGIFAIKDDTFRNCSKLAAVTLPTSVKTVEQGAFAGCSVLKNVHYSGSAIDKFEIDIDAENGELVSAQWHCAVEEEEQTVAKKDTATDAEMPPWLTTTLYIVALVVAIGLLVLVFRNASED